MASRLDRLFVLLDSGSSSVTRKAAAVQLGEVQKLHPHELNNLLAQLHQYICKPSWETRIAAGQAVEAIAKNVPIWNPQDVALKEENRDNLNKEKTVSQTGRMKFSLFDIDKVLNSGSFLVGSEGKEYEHDNEMTGSAAAGGLDPKEQLASQRQLLNKKLGLDVAQKIGIDTSDIFTNDDLQVYSPSQDNKDAQRKLKAAQKKAVAELVESQMSQISGLSSREMNRAKRKARLVAKQKSKETLNNKDNGSSSNPEGEPVAKKVKSVLVNQPSTDDSLVVDNVIDRSAPLWEENTCWPFESFCDQLCQDLFSPSWETRHGAATALREVIKIHGGGAGKSLDIPADQLEEVNQLWLEDVALRLLCVMALDRFGDFISDQVVAPVRETCAQVLGFVFNLMWKSSVQDVLSIVLQLLNRPEWEVRHGGLLAMKYLLAVRKDMTSDLLPSTFVHIYQGLSDPMDDVVAVAASALVPVSDCLIEVLPDEVMNIIDCLWDSLLEIDDLCASTSSIMALLTSLLSHPSQSSMKTTKPWNELVPRLWPFMNHTSTAVRKCVLKTLLILTKPEISLNYQTWIPIIIQDFMRHLYQRCILEHDPSILHVLFEIWRQLLLGSSLQSILTSACPFLSSWLCLMMQPAQIPIDSNSLLQASHKAKSRRSIGADEELISENKHYIGGESSLHDSLIEKEESVVRCRCMAARFLGLLSCYIKQPMPGIVYTSDMESPIDCYSKLITFHLNSRSALQRFCISLVVKEWAIADKSFVFPEAIKNRLLEALSECIYYDEIAVSFTTCQQECLNFISTMRHYQLSIDDAFQCGSVLTLEQALHLSQTVSLHLINDMKNKPKVKERLEERRKSILHTVQMTNKEFQHLNIKVQASLASAVVHIGCLPPKLNPVIRPIMEAIKKEVVCQLQRNAGRTLTLLLELCLTREPCPNAKILNNLSTFLCSHSAATPNISMNRKNDLTNGKDDLFNGVSPVNDDYDGIITLLNLQKEAEKTALKRSTSVTSKKSQAAITDENSEEKNTEIQKKGAEIALSELCQHFGINLPKKLPKLWEIIFNPIDAYMNAVSSDTNFNKFRDQITSAQELVFSLQVLEIVGYSVHDDLKVFLESHLPHLSMCLRHPYNAVRYMASQVFGMFSKVLCMQTMKVILDQVVPLLSCSEIESRQGACETLACVINHLGVKISPYIVLLILPSLGRMSDQNPAVRTMATHCFGTLIRLMPLEGGLKAELPELSEDLIERREKERKFLDQLLNTNKLESFQMPVPINAKLRTYQQDGVNWLWFLNQYKLHGILCDDMGLGKTIQSICILAGDHHYKKKAAEENPQLGPLSPSLVVCPPTLTGHWVYEVDKFISTEYLNPLHYAGSPAERERLQKRAKHHNLIIASYDIVRNDFDFFGRVKWNYCILDEGHIIKNGKTKLAKAIKQLTANHRLVLSGTPIQNSVLELWSLFDFLMPGFLGTEKQFQAQYSKPILLSRDAKSSSREQEAGAMAMESLHRQVLPFLLRRMKEDVLKDLPPKIIQDYCCELSPLQQQLYEDFEKTKAKRSVEETLSHEEEKVNEHEATHIFQALQYLRKVCNHPKLVLTKLHPQFDKIMDQINHQGSVLTDISHAAKLPALKQLLLDCGIGQIGNGNNSAQTQEPVVNQHRALIFCQLKSMLDIVERDLLKTHMPSVTYLRLDGSVPAGQRHSVVHRFNSDPSIDLLLLTTQVGGVGLNLTGADTVIFVEHDWNPMRDLQAMDRAHRIGQKKVVNVYRLITKGTLEEKIMSLQQFKLSVANTVISEDNSSLQTMGTDNLLDLFSLDESKSKDHLTRRDSVNPRESNAVKNIIDNLPDLWEESQYEDEYDLSHFMRGLVKK